MINDVIMREIIRKEQGAGGRIMPDRKRSVRPFLPGASGALILQQWFLRF
jgi:hypothetical protein